jgi:hypothetical protein
MVKETFTVTVDSPHGKQAIEQFRHFLHKISDEAEARWGITITVEKQTDIEHTEGFNNE